MDEQVLKKIIQDNVNCKDEKSLKLNLIVYYKNREIKSMLIRNNLTRKKTKRDIDQAYIIYALRCPNDEFIRQKVNNVYTGYTTCTLPRRLSLQLNKGNNKSAIH